MSVDLMLSVLMTTEEFFFKAQLIMTYTLRVGINRPWNEKADWDKMIDLIKETSFDASVCKGRVRGHIV